MTTTATTWTDLTALEPQLIALLAEARLAKEALIVATTATQPALELHDAPARHQERRPTIYVACEKCGALIPQKKGFACGWCGRRQA